MVTYLDKFAKENEFLKALEEAKFHYNVDNIITQIRVAHEARVVEAEKEHEEELAELYRGFNDDQNEVKEVFAVQLTDLGEEREGAIELELGDQAMEISAIKKAFEDKKS